MSNEIPQEAGSGLIANVPGVGNSEQPQTQPNPELITGIPDELGGAEITAATEAQIKADADRRAQYPLGAGASVINSKVPAHIVAQELAQAASQTPGATPEQPEIH